MNPENDARGIRSAKYEKKTVFIKIKPKKKIFCYGLGLSLRQLRKEHERGGITVIIPPERL